MRTRWKTIAAPLAAAALLTFAVAAPAQADDGEEATPADQVSTSEWAVLYGAVDDATGTFDYEQAAAELDERLVEEFAAGWEAGGGVVAGGPEDLAVSSDLEALAVEASAAGCPGRDRYWGDGWGSHWEMNQCAATILKNNLLGGAITAGGIATITAASGAGLPVSVVSALVTVLGGLGAGAVDNCMAPGRGITLHFTYAVIWCGSQ